jgi:small subunit ribosomal protein S1
MTEAKHWEEQPDEGYWQLVLGGTPSTPPAQSTQVTENAPPAASGWVRAEASYAQGETLDLRVIGYNRGGLLVDLGDVRGFVPASQLSNLPRQLADDERIQALARYVDTTLKLKVIEFDRVRNRLILSERIVNPPVSRAEQLFAEIQPNEIRQGTVRNITNFGAFVDLGGVEGLIHVSELSWQYVSHPNQILSPGQQIDVFIMEVNREQKRIACSLKRLKPNPWADITTKVKPGDWVSGVVTSVVAFGAFVRIAEGVEGLLHISELAGRDFTHPRDLLQEGQTVQVRVMELEPSQQRMKLSLRPIAERGNGSDPARNSQWIESWDNVPPPPENDDAYWESLIK